MTQATRIGGRINVYHNFCNTPMVKVTKLNLFFGGQQTHESKEGVVIDGDGILYFGTSQQDHDTNIQELFQCHKAKVIA